MAYALRLTQADKFPSGETIDNLGTSAWERDADNARPISVVSIKTADWVRAVTSISIEKEKGIRISKEARQVPRIRKWPNKAGVTMTSVYQGGLAVMGAVIFGREDAGKERKAAVGARNDGYRWCAFPQGTACHLHTVRGSEEGGAKGKKDVDTRGSGKQPKEECGGAKTPKQEYSPQPPRQTTLKIQQKGWEYGLRKWAGPTESWEGAVSEKEGGRGSVFICWLP